MNNILTISCIMCLAISCGNLPNNYDVTLDRNYYTIRTKECPGMTNFQTGIGCSRYYAVYGSINVKNGNMFLDGDLILTAHSSDYLCSIYRAFIGICQDTSSYRLKAFMIYDRIPKINIYYSDQFDIFKIIDNSGILLRHCNDIEMNLFYNESVIMGYTKAGRKCLSK